MTKQYRVSLAGGVSGQLFNSYVAAREFVTHGLFDGKEIEVEINAGDYEDTWNALDQNGDEIAYIVEVVF